jgi:hypothetical protein
MACKKCEQRRKWLAEQGQKAKDKFKTVSIKRKSK